MPIESISQQKNPLLCADSNVSLLSQNISRVHIATTPSAPLASQSTRPAWPIEIAGSSERRKVDLGGDGLSLLPESLYAPPKAPYLWQLSIGDGMCYGIVVLTSLASLV